MKKTFPPWIRWRAPDPKMLEQMQTLLADLGLHTVCESAMCPNIGFCYGRKTATFLLLGDVCTRNCRFCAVKKGRPLPVNPDEPDAIAEAVRRLGLKYVVITSVTRDDLPDGGAFQFVNIIERLAAGGGHIRVEVLIPDFKGAAGPLGAVVAAGPAVVNHNIETVARLYPEVRPGAGYGRSLRLLSEVKHMQPETITKSGMMLGLGETEEEVHEAMRDLRQAGCDLLTLGQYLRPSAGHHEIGRFIPPGEFSDYGRMALEMGFKGVAAGPLVRSSFKAEALYLEAKTDQYQSKGPAYDERRSDQKSGPGHYRTDCTGSGYRKARS